MWSGHCNNVDCDCRSARPKYAEGKGILRVAATRSQALPCASRLHILTRWIRMATRPLRTFTVLPNLPPEMQGLQELSYNVWWCWNHDAIALFRRIDEKK